MHKFFKNKNPNIYLTLTPKPSSGFAVLFSVLLASFLITLGISIFSVSLKEIMINTAVRDSQIAYYIADSARECALYWQIKRGALPACNDFDHNDIDCASYYNNNGDKVTGTTPIRPTIMCNNIPVTLTFNKSGLIYSASAVNFFHASSTSSSTPVSDIVIINKANVGGEFTTTIVASGHNTSIIGRRVERGIQTTNGR